MQLSVLDSNFQIVDIIDLFRSLIWHDRYNEAGEFELKIQAFLSSPHLVRGNYIQNSQSEHLMIIEKIQLDTSVEDGNYLIVTGRSIESILDRRIIWGQATITGSLQAGIESLLNACVISPSNADRAMNVAFVESADPLVTSLSANAQYTGDDLYSVISSLCQDNDIGFKMVLNSSNVFEFSLYAGLDHSYQQTVNPYVIFSPEFNNIITSTYTENDIPFKNVALVAGVGEGDERVTISVGSASGLNRRELYVDARDISDRIAGSNEQMSSSDYNNLLTQRGTSKLAEAKTETVYDGEVDYSRQFIFGSDYFIGDIVELVNGFGQSSIARVTEAIIYQDEAGYKIVPTFEAIDEVPSGGTPVAESNVTTSEGIYSEGGQYAQAADGLILAWAACQGTTIKAGNNISSFSQVSSGTYQVTFINALASGDYAAFVSVEVSGNAQEIVGVYNKTTTGFRFDVSNYSGTFVTPAFANILVIGTR